jgi:hypothetical protein
MFRVLELITLDLLSYSNTVSSTWNSPSETPNRWSQYDSVPDTSSSKRFVSFAPPQVSGRPLRLWWRYRSVQMVWYFPLNLFPVVMVCRRTLSHLGRDRKVRKGYPIIVPSTETHSVQVISTRKWVSHRLDQSTLHLSWDSLVSQPLPNDFCVFPFHGKGSRSSMYP